MYKNVPHSSIGGYIDVICTLGMFLSPYLYLKLDKKVHLTIAWVPLSDAWGFSPSNKQWCQIGTSPIGTSLSTIWRNLEWSCLLFMWYCSSTCPGYSGLFWKYGAGHAKHEGFEMDSLVFLTCPPPPVSCKILGTSEESEEIETTGRQKIG